MSRISLGDHLAFYATLTEAERARYCDIPQDRLPETEVEKRAVKRCKDARKQRAIRARIKEDEQKYKKYLAENKRRQNRRRFDRATREGVLRAQKRSYRKNRSKVLEREKKKYDELKADEERYQKFLLRIKPGKEVVCPTCSCVHKTQSRTTDECDRCRGIVSRRKREEEEIAELLLAHDIHFSYHDMSGPCKSPWKTRRPDFVFESNEFNWTVILEVDEDQHKGGGYTPECEIARMADIRDQFPGKPIYMIRFAPLRRRSNCDADESVYLSMVKASETKLLSTLRAAFSLTEPKEGELPLGYHIEYIGYDDDRVKGLLSRRDEMHAEALQTFEK